MTRKYINSVGKGVVFLRDHHSSKRLHSISPLAFLGLEKPKVLYIWECNSAPLRIHAILLRLMD
jgi:hypothetical protein